MACEQTATLHELSADVRSLDNRTTSLETWEKSQNGSLARIEQTVDKLAERQETFKNLLLVACLTSLSSCLALLFQSLRTR